MVIGLCYTTIINLKKRVQLELKENERSVFIVGSQGAMSISLTNSQTFPHYLPLRSITPAAWDRTGLWLQEHMIGISLSDSYCHLRWDFKFSIFTRSLDWLKSRNEYQVSWQVSRQKGPHRSRSVGILAGLQAEGAIQEQVSRYPGRSLNIGCHLLPASLNSSGANTIREELAKCEKN